MNTERRLRRAVAEKGRATDYLLLMDHIVTKPDSIRILTPIVEEALERNPNSADLLNRAIHMALFAAQRSDLRTEAIMLTDSLATVAGTEFATNFSAAEAYRLLGKPKRAKRHYKAALKYASASEERKDALEGLKLLG